MSNELVGRINAAVDTAYRGVPVEYHKTLGERLCEAISNWVREDCLEDVLNNIRYARGSVEALILDDVHSSRYGGHVG